MRITAKLAFIHRLLWKRDQVYVAAVLLGPPPLIGCALAAAIWWMLQPGAAPLAEPPGRIPWAHLDRPILQDTQPYSEISTFKLPRSGPAGDFPGFQTGWRGTIQPMTVDATMDVTVVGSTLTTFNLDQTAIPLSRILDAGPPSGLFVGVASTLLVIRTPGLYALSLRFERSAARSANCLFRLGTPKHRLIRSISLNMNGDSVLNLPPTEFRLEPGLYPIGLAAGCWRGDQMVGPGELTLMIRHPGEKSLQPVRADEVIRQGPKAN